jgi:hypothetical protein
MRLYKKNLQLLSNWKRHQEILKLGYEVKDFWDFYTVPQYLFVQYKGMKQDFLVIWKEVGQSEIYFQNQYNDKLAQIVEE